MKNKQVALIIAGFVVLSAIVAGAAWVLRGKNPQQDAASQEMSEESRRVAVGQLVMNQVPVSQVFTNAAGNPRFVQVSFFSVEKFEDGEALGSGRVRYSDGKQIYGYGGGRNAVNVSATFIMDKQSKEYISCAEAFSQPVPLGYELFIAGEGISIIAPGTPINGSARAQFEKINSCGITQTR